VRWIDMTAKRSSGMAARRAKLGLLDAFPRLTGQTKYTVAMATKGIRVLELRLRILDLLRGYDVLTVRMLHYRLVSTFDYPNDRNFFKRTQYSLKVLRRLFPELRAKFEDPTRQVSNPMMPRPGIELWHEKSSLEVFSRRLAERYHVPTLAERGFGSLTMFFKAVVRAKKRGVRKILLLTDHDPSGLLIDRITRREMPIEVERIALTMEQIRRYRLPPLRVKRSDSRAKEYIRKFGDNAWEVEALPPKALLSIIRKKIVENLPKGFLEGLKSQEEAARIVRPLEREMVRGLREEAMKMRRKGLSAQQILSALRRRFRPRP